MLRNKFSLKGLFHRRFYNRLMLYNMIIFTVFVYMFAFIAIDYSARLNRMEQNQKNRDALNTICMYYGNKHDDFFNLILPLYEEPKNYSVITNLLESKSDQDYINDPYKKQEIVDVMQKFIIRDADIEAILIHKNLTGARYVYNSSSQTLEYVGPHYPFFDKLAKKSAGRDIYGTDSIYSGRSTVKVYGIAGTLGTYTIRYNAGSLMVAYRTQAIERVLEKYMGETKGRFLLVTRDGDVIFDSMGQYEEKFKYMDVLLSGAESAVIDGEFCYIQTIPVLKRKYIGVHIIRKADIEINDLDFRKFIFTIFSAMVLIFGILYFISGSIISRRVNELIKGMKLIGSNNLSYRIPLRNKMDEFEEISIRFNEMCDELESIINREYINEIKKKNAELKALQAGINPHFLYNTLEAIRIRAKDDGNDDIAEMVILLANLYRSIVKDDTFIPISKEINICRMYLNIFLLRYGGSFECEINIDHRIMGYGIPKNLLQPIIENYFLHGIRNDYDDNRFTITGSLMGDEIIFTFEDNGRGIEERQLKELQNRLINMDINEPSYGLVNVHGRIRLVYGESYGLWIDSNGIDYTCVQIRIRALTCDQLKNSIQVIN